MTTDKHFIFLNPSIDGAPHEAERRSFTGEPFGPLAVTPHYIVDAGSPPCKSAYWRLGRPGDQELILQCLLASSIPPSMVVDLRDRLHVYWFFGQDELKRPSIIYHDHRRRYPLAEMNAWNDQILKVFSAIADELAGS